MSADAPAAELNYTPSPGPSEAQRVFGVLEDHKARLEKVYGIFGPPVAAAQQEVSKAREAELKVQKEIIPPLRGEYLRTLTTPLREQPQLLPQPPVKDISGRPFMDNPKAKDTLTNVVSLLGTMAQMAMAGRAPVAALNAFSGAMNGWAEGDQIRADREWRKYLGEVDRITRENAQSQHAWENAVKAHGLNELAARAQYIVALDELGLKERATAAAQQGMQDARHTLEYMEKQEKDLTTQTIAMNQWLATHETNRLIREQAQQSQKDARAQAERHFQMNFNERVREFNIKRQDQEGTHNLTPETLQGIADAVNMGVPMSNFSFGMGRKAAEAKVDVMNAVFSNPANTPEQLAKNMQLYRGVQAGLNKNIQMKAQIGSFINTADHVMTLATTASKKVDRATGMPIVEKWIQAGRRAIEGDPDLTSFDLLNNSVAHEYARVMNSATGGGITTVSATERALSLLNTAFNDGQYAQAIKTIRDEMHSRVKGFEEETAALQDALPKLRKTPGLNPGASNKGLPEGTKMEGSDLISESGKYVWRNGAWQSR